MSTNFYTNLIFIYKSGRFIDVNSTSCPVFASGGLTALWAPSTTACAFADRAEMSYLSAVVTADVTRRAHGFAVVVSTTAKAGTALWWLALIKVTIATLSVSSTRRAVPLKVRGSVRIVSAVIFAPLFVWLRCLESGCAGILLRASIVVKPLGCRRCK
jgi:hypothetical protein